MEEVDWREILNEDKILNKPEPEDYKFYLSSGLYKCCRIGDTEKFKMKTKINQVIITNKTDKLVFAVDTDEYKGKKH